jgi:hypothetical protein
MSKTYRFKRTARNARRKGEVTVKTAKGWKNKKYKK